MWFVREAGCKGGIGVDLGDGRLLQIGVLRRLSN